MRHRNILLVDVMYTVSVRVLTLSQASHAITASILCSVCEAFFLVCVLFVFAPARMLGLDQQCYWQTGHKDSSRTLKIPKNHRKTNTWLTTPKNSSVSTDELLWPVSTPIRANFAESNNNWITRSTLTTMGVFVVSVILSVMRCDLQCLVFVLNSWPGP